MTKRNLIRNLAILFALLLCCSCIPQEQPEGTGDVSLVFSTASITRAETPGDGTPADGGGIATTGTPETPDLYIYLVNSAEPPTVSAIYYPGCDPLVATNGKMRTGFKAARDTVTFSNIPAGAYTVYAFANTEGLALDGTPDLTAITTKAELDALLFAELAVDPDTIALSNSRLPLAATAPLTVTENHNGAANVELLRCLAKVSVELINQTGGTLSLADLADAPGLDVKLAHMNPRKGYVFAHDPDVPSASYDSVGFTCSSVSIANSDTLKLTRLVFPSDTLTCGGYTCKVSFCEGVKEYSYEDLPILDNRARPLTILPRNTHLRIQIRIGRSKLVSFNFLLEDWAAKTETLTFE